MNKPILLTIIFAVVALFGFKQYDQGATKETMTIIAKGNLVSISSSDQSFRVRKLKAEENEASRYGYDYTSILKLVNEYQSSGWQIKSSNLTSSTDFIGDQGFETHTLYFLLEK